MKNTFFNTVVLIGLLAAAPPARAQWQTQSLIVKPGWTAIYLHVDPSYTNLDTLIGGDPNNPISEVWQWTPAAGTIQYVTSPLAPTSGNSQWSSWVRNGAGLGTSLSSMVPNAAYLVHSLASSNYTWSVKGKPIAPNYIWSTTGLNLVGFSTQDANPPALDTFLSLAPNFQSVADVYQYTGGALGPANPSSVFAPHTVPVTRGEAFWIRAGSFLNTYFGPFTVAVGNSGFTFTGASSQVSFHLQNTTPSTITVQAQLTPSETPPAGQAPIAGVPPIVVRGALNSSNLTYAASALSAASPVSWTLPPQGQPGSDLVIQMGVNQAAFAGSPPGNYAGIIRFTDSLNYTEVDIPVSAQPASYAGLWVGSASVSQVASYLKVYQTDANNNPVVGTNGAYIVTGVNTNLGAVSTPFPLRLIVHNDGANVYLLSGSSMGRTLIPTA